MQVYVVLFTLTKQLQIERLSIRMHWSITRVPRLWQGPTSGSWEEWVSRLCCARFIYSMSMKGLGVTAGFIIMRNRFVILSSLYLNFWAPSKVEPQSITVCDTLIDCCVRPWQMCWMLIPTQAHLRRLSCFSLSLMYPLSPSPERSPNLSPRKRRWLRKWNSLATSPTTLPSSWRFSKNAVSSTRFPRHIPLGSNISIVVDREYMLLFSILEFQITDNDKYFHKEIRSFRCRKGGRIYFTRW